MVDTAAQIWRDYVTDGVPASGVHKPIKSEIRAWGADVETRVMVCATRAALKAIVPVSGYTAALTEPTREGVFVFRSGNYSALVAADVLEGIYLRADTIAATVGAWVRQRDSLDVLASWFGASGNGVFITGNTSITSGASLLTVAGAAFTSGDIGKKISIPGAGASGGVLVSTIATCVSPTSVTLANNAGTTLAAVSKSVFYGTDDEAAINAAIAALPVTGGNVLLAGTCAIGAQINIGNGTSSAVSTRYGVMLKGMAPPIYFKDGSHPVTSQASLVWVGGGAGTMVFIGGPLIGWGVENLLFDGRSVVDFGLSAMSAARGWTSNLTFVGCKTSYALGCYSGTIGFAPDISANTENVRGGNIVIHMPNVTGAIGILFDGPADGSASTCFCEIDVVRVYPSETNANYGIIFKVADGVRVKNYLYYTNAYVAGSYPVIYDYSGNSTFPSACLLDGPDVGWNVAPGYQFVNSGTPGAYATSNFITNLSEINGGRYPVTLANVICDLPKKIPSGVHLTGQTSAIAATTFNVPKIATQYRISWQLRMTTAGTGGTISLVLSWKDPAGFFRNIYSTGMAASSTANSDQGVVLLTSSLVSPYLNYQVNFSGVTGSPQYAVDIIVERMD